MILGVNKYGVKLEDYIDYKSYKRAIKNASLRAYYASNREKHLKRCLKYQQTEIGKKNHKKRAKKFYDKVRAANSTGFGLKAPKKAPLEL